MASELRELPHNGAPRTTWQKKKDGSARPIYTYRSAHDLIRALHNESTEFKIQVIRDEASGRVFFNPQIRVNHDGWGNVRFAFLRNGMRVSKPSFLKKGEDKDSRVLVKNFWVPVGEQSETPFSEDTYETILELWKIFELYALKAIKEAYPGRAAYNFYPPKQTVEFALKKFDDIYYDEEGNKTTVQGVENTDDLFKKRGKPIVYLTFWGMDHKEGDKANTAECGIKMNLDMNEKYLTDAEIRVIEAERDLQREKNAASFVPPPASKKRSSDDSGAPSKKSRKTNVPVTSDAESGVEDTPVKKPRAPRAKAPKEPKEPKKAKESKKIALPPPPVESEDEEIDLMSESELSDEE